jgi:hypothetical protein
LFEIEIIIKVNQKGSPALIVIVRWVDGEGRNGRVVFRFRVVSR